MLESNVMTLGGIREYYDVLVLLKSKRYHSPLDYHRSTSFSSLDCYISFDLLIHITSVTNLIQILPWSCLNHLPRRTIPTSTRLYTSMKSSDDATPNPQNQLEDHNDLSTTIDKLHIAESTSQLTTVPFQNYDSDEYEAIQ